VARVEGRDKSRPSIWIPILPVLSVSVVANRSCLRRKLGHDPGFPHRLRCWWQHLTDRRSLCVIGRCMSSPRSVYPTHHPLDCGFDPAVCRFRGSHTSTDRSHSGCNVLIVWCVLELTHRTSSFLWATSVFDARLGQESDTVMADLEPLSDLRVRYRLGHTAQGHAIQGARDVGPGPLYSIAARYPVASLAPWYTSQAPEAQDRSKLLIWRVSASRPLVAPSQALERLR
jgi:hypothetical protein